MKNLTHYTPGKIFRKRATVLFYNARDEAVKRIVERDNKTAEEAEKRLNSQNSNQERCQVKEMASTFLVLDSEITINVK